VQVVLDVVDQRPDADDLRPERQRREKEPREGSRRRAPAQ
jgi:hypothetical protein